VSSLLIQQKLNEPPAGYTGPYSVCSKKGNYFFRDKKIVTSCMQIEASQSANTYRIEFHYATQYYIVVGEGSGTNG
jgi:hypothetical protein